MICGLGIMKIGSKALCGKRENKGVFQEVIKAIGCI
jgi:hypothetical protein